MSEEIGFTFHAWPWPWANEEDIPSTIRGALGDVLRETWEVQQRPLEGEELAPNKTPTLMVDGTWNYGLLGAGEIDEDVLQEAGIAYVIYDSAKYEFNAGLRWWHPGMEEPREEASDQDYNVVMTRRDWEKLLESKPRDDQVADLVSEFFANPWLWDPPADHQIKVPPDEDEIAAEHVRTDAELLERIVGDEVSNALALLVLNEDHRAYLEQHDPKALEQARAALGLPVEVTA